MDFILGLIVTFIASVWVGAVLVHFYRFIRRKPCSDCGKKARLLEYPLGFDQNYNPTGSVFVCQTCFDKRVYAGRPSDHFKYWPFDNRQHGKDLN